nr:hypothetical protein [uncultured Campylobacter sp.]
MDGNELEATMGIAKDMKGWIYSRIYDLAESGGPDLSQDEDYLELRNLTDRIYREKDKTTEYWEAEMDRLWDRLNIKLGIKAQ